MISKLKTNILEAMEANCELEHEIRNYFHFDSKLLKRINEYIHKNSDNGLIPWPKDHLISRNEIHYVESGIFAKELVGNTFLPREIFYIKITASFYHKDEDDEERDNIHFTEEIKIPVDLELNFTEEKFEDWVLEKEAIKKHFRKEKELVELKRLVEKYWEETLEIINV